MAPSASTLQQLACSLHERWEGLGPQAMDAIQDKTTSRPRWQAPQFRSAASWWRCGPTRSGALKPAVARPLAARSPSITPGPAPAKAGGGRLKALYFAGMPESGKPALKAQLASEVAHIRQFRPDIAITSTADGAPDNWTFLEVMVPSGRGDSIRRNS